IKIRVFAHLAQVLELVLVRVHRPEQVQLQPQLLLHLAPSRSHRFLVRLNLPTRSQPEPKQLPIPPHHRTPDQQHPPSRIKHQHPRCPPRPHPPTSRVNCPTASARCPPRAPPPSPSLQSASIQA